MNKHPFAGHVISGRPVVIQDLKDTGIIKPDRDPSKPEYWYICPNCGSDDVIEFYCRNCDTDFKPKIDETKDKD